nr:hypothetical protein [Lachnospiraceae bacterium]
MELQKILFPNKDICPDFLMYFRGDARPQIPTDDEAPRIGVKKGETLSLESYFNAFSVGKWKEFTRLEDLTLKLFLTGEADIRALHVIGDKEDTIFRARSTAEKTLKMHRREEEADAAVIREDGGYRVDFRNLYEEGILFAEITAKEDLYFCGGAYETKETKRNDVRISFNICT